MKDTCGIYKIVYNKNIEKKKIYIGQSINIEKRLKEHKRKLEKNTHSNNQMQNIYNKHGFKYFTFEIIEECKREELDEREIFWISYYDSYKNGLNETIGGSGTTGRFHSDEYKIKSSIRAKELGINKKQISQYTLDGKFIRNWDSATDVHNELNYDISSICGVCKGNGNYAYGYVWRYAKDNFYTYNSSDNLRKPVDKYDLYGNFLQTYESAHFVENLLGFSSTSISACCKGKNISAYGFIWRFGGEQFEKYNTKITRNRKIVQLSLQNEYIKTWDNLKSINIENCNKTSIRDCCRGNTQKNNGFKWMCEYDYLNKTELYNKIISYNIELKHDGSYKHKNRYKEIDMIDSKTYEILKTFDSIGKASEYFKTNPSNISYALHKNGKSHGYYWKFKKDRVEDKHEMLDLFNKNKAVLQINKDTYEVINTFDSMVEANLYFGRGRQCANISRAISNYHTSYGFLWILKQDYDNKTSKYYDMIKNKEEVKINKLFKSINQIEPNSNKIINTFGMIIEAKRYLGVGNNNSINRVLSGKIETAHGFKWEYSNKEK